MVRAYGETLIDFLESLWTIHFSFSLRKLAGTSLPRKHADAFTDSPVPVDPPLWGADPGERQATVGRQSRLVDPASHCAEGTIPAQLVGQHLIDTAHSAVQKFRQ
jgi:hypothetical protein